MTEYVSAEWVVDELTGDRSIRAVTDEGRIDFVPGILSDVPPWPEYMEAVRAGTKAITGEPPPE